MSESEFEEHAITQVQSFNAFLHAAFDDSTRRDFREFAFSTCKKLPSASASGLR
ncbi:MAG: hypothetical protein WA777_08915 [Rhodanobacter sp.]